MPGSSAFPSGLDNFAEASPTNLADSDTTGRTHTERHDDVEAAVEAIETELGVDPAGIYGTVRARLDALTPQDITSLALESSGTAVVPLSVQAFAGQTADLTQWRNSGGTAVASVSATGGVAVPLGAAGTPTLAFTGDPNTGIWSPAADTLAVSTGGTERLRVNSAGDVGIGASPGATFHVAKPTAVGHGVAAFANLDVSGTYNTDITLQNSNTAGNSILSRRTNGELWLYQSGAWPISFHTSATERMRIDSAGLITGTGPSLGAWTAYTPTLGGTGWAIGDGTVAGYYCQIGKIVHFKARITFGSTSTYGASALEVSMPVTRRNTLEPQFAGHALDTSTGTRYPMVAFSNTTTTVAPIGASTNANYTTSSPFAWESGDIVYVSGTYEAA